MKNSFKKTGVSALATMMFVTGCSSPAATNLQNQNVRTSDASQSSNVVAQKLDASDCNPGVSINPVDKGKTIQSTNFKYTLLDVRTDDLALDPALLSSMQYKKVLLVKLQVENISQKDDLNLSGAEVDLTRVKAPSDDRIGEDSYVTDYMYPKSKVCVNLGADVAKGTFAKGSKVVGYYVYALPEDKPYTSGLYFGARYYAAEDVATGKSLKIAGTFKLQ